MQCKNAKQTGKPCAGGYSREIICGHSQTNCLRDCTPQKCRYFDNGITLPDGIAAATPEAQEYFRKIKEQQVRQMHSGCCG